MFVSAFASSGLGSVITTQLYLTTLKFTQSEMILPNVVGLVAAIPANILGAVRSHLEIFIDSLASNAPIPCRYAIGLGHTLLHG